MALIICLDSEKQIVQQRGDDLEFFDHPQYYIYNKLGQVNSLEDRNSHSFQIDEKKGIVIEKMLTRFTI